MIVPIIGAFWKETTFHEVDDRCINMCHGYRDQCDSLTLSGTKYRSLWPNPNRSTKYLISYKVIPLFIIKLVSLMGRGWGNSGLWQNIENTDAPLYYGGFVSTKLVTMLQTITRTSACGYSSVFCRDYNNHNLSKTQYQQLRQFKEVFHTLWDQKNFKEVNVCTSVWDKLLHKIIVVLPCILISTKLFYQQMHLLLKHKMLQFIFKIPFLLWLLHVSVPSDHHQGAYDGTLPKLVFLNH